MTLTEEVLTIRVVGRLGLSKATSAGAVETTFEVIKEILERGEDVLIRDFGKFWVKDKDKGRGQKRGDQRRPDVGGDAGCDTQVVLGAKKKPE